MFDRELISNRALTEQSAAFHPPYPERIGDFMKGEQVQTGAIVREDGSVLFECPANVPIAIQPLDAEGKHLQEMRSWFAAMPGETLSCLGCHQDQNAAPPSGTRTRASLKPPQKIRFLERIDGLQLWAFDCLR